MALLEIKDLSIRFGGLKALTDFNFSLDPGQLLGLIGPNGAGKTTVFNVVNGMYRPTSGSIVFDGKEIAGRPTFRINQYGIARTFQNIRLFGGLSVVDNVLIGFNSTVRVTLGSNPSSGTLSGTVSVAASSGVAFFDTLMINKAGSGYTLVASTPGFGSIESAPFTVIGASGAAARAQ